MSSDSQEDQFKTVGELRKLLDGVPDSARVDIDKLHPGNKRTTMGAMFFSDEGASQYLDIDNDRSQVKVVCICEVAVIGRLALYGYVKPPADKS